MVYSFNEPERVDVLVDETEEVKLCSLEGYDEYSEPGKETHFFQDELSAQQYLESILPKNLDQMKDYLSYLYDESKFTELKEMLPETMFKRLKEGYDSSVHFTYFEWEIVKRALSGHITIEARTIKFSDVVMVTSLADERRELLLSNGERIISKESIEQKIIDAVFIHRTAGKYINR